ncbi:Ataxin-7-like protein 3 [Microtus ochrogaster]|uniref:Ataxin-7-like protein 3 n=1 Tax=Microtus ochrogaster TaxID=79684 RepID=A0A8J6H0F9_MICOH|nr:Ataxin-7-like protein 3 [Microtus ochrogaster]
MRREGKRPWPPGEAARRGGRGSPTPCPGPGPGPRGEARTDRRTWGSGAAAAAAAAGGRGSPGGPCCRPLCYEQSKRRLHKSLQMKMEEMSLSGLDNSKLEAIAQEICADLVEYSCLGFCFEVLRAVKCGYFFLDDTDPDSMKDFEIVDQPGLDIFGQVFNQWKSKECVCPNCSGSIAASRFTPHLEKCLGMGWNSSRIANSRIANSNNMNKSESDQEDNDDREESQEEKIRQEP